VLDLYAGCPGFNVSVEALYMLALAGMLESGDLAVIVGAENIHRAKAFPPLDTANIHLRRRRPGHGTANRLMRRQLRSGRIMAEAAVDAGEDFIDAIAAALLPWAVEGRLDGIIVDNQLGRVECRVPATAARVQHALMQRLFRRRPRPGHSRISVRPLNLRRLQGRLRLRPDDRRRQYANRAAYNQRLYGLWKIPPPGGSIS